MKTIFTISESSVRFYEEIWKEIFGKSGRTNRSVKGIYLRDKSINVMFNNVALRKSWLAWLYDTLDTRTRNGNTHSRHTPHPHRIGPFIAKPRGRKGKEQPPGGREKERKCRSAPPPQDTSASKDKTLRSRGIRWEYILGDLACHVSLKRSTDERRVFNAINHRPELSSTSPI